MRAEIGDKIVIKAHHIGEPDRSGEVLEVRGDGGKPPYLVRWTDDGHVALVFPGTDAVIEHLGSGAAA